MIVVLLCPVHRAAFEPFCCREAACIVDIYPFRHIALGRERLCWLVLKSPSKSLVNPCGMPARNAAIPGMLGRVGVKEYSSIS